mgnify:CR=1 FL=1
MEKRIIELYRRKFDDIRHEEDGIEYWYARELMTLLDYVQWRNFENVVKKGMLSCKSNGIRVEDHFAGVSKMVTLGSGANREVEDVMHVEEFVFRGFIFEKIKRVAGKDIIAVIISSVFFGVFHFFSGNLVQMVMTACIGAFFCFCRLKIKNCSTLSLIIGHGVYDALITVFASALL